jgi:hypothetical protein
VPEPRGSGAGLTAMTPLWGTPPRAGSPFRSAMDEGIGVKTRWQIQDGGRLRRTDATRPCPGDRRPGGEPQAHGTGQASAVAFCQQFRPVTPRPISRC